MKFITFSGFLMSAAAAVDYMGTAIATNSNCSPFQFALLMDVSTQNTTCDANISGAKAALNTTDLSCIDGSKINAAGRLYAKIECATTSSVDAYAAKVFPGIKYLAISTSTKADCSEPPAVVMMFPADGSCVRMAGGSVTGSAKVTAKSDSGVTFIQYDSNDCSGTAKAGSGDLPAAKLGKCNSGVKYFLSQGSPSPSQFAVNLASIAAVVASVVKNLLQ